MRKFREDPYPEARNATGLGGGRKSESQAGSMDSGFARNRNQSCVGGPVIGQGLNRRCVPRLWARCQLAAE
jgi:hypothetical protein